MKVIGWALLFVFALGVLMAGCFALVNDEDSLAPVRVQLISHERERCYYDECEDGRGYGGRYDDDGGYGSDYGHNRRDDRNRNRGAFSPGPFDRSPIDLRNSCISLDCSGRDRDDEDRERGGPELSTFRPASLFPPGPDAIRAFVVNTTKAGLELGQAFADLTISFVSNLLIGIASA